MKAVRCFSLHSKKSWLVSLQGHVLMDLPKPFMIAYKVSLPTNPSVYPNNGDGQRSHHATLYFSSSSSRSKAIYSQDGMSAKCSMKAIGIKGRSLLMDSIGLKVSWHGMHLSRHLWQSPGVYLWLGEGFSMRILNHWINSKVRTDNPNFDFPFYNGFQEQSFLL